MGRPCSYPGEGSRTWLIVVFTGHIIICEESEKNCNVTIGQVACNSRLGNQQEIFAQILFNIIPIMKHLFAKKNLTFSFLQIRQIFTNDSDIENLNEWQVTLHSFNPVLGYAISIDAKGFNIPRITLHTRCLRVPELCETLGLYDGVLACLGLQIITI